MTSAPTCDPQQISELVRRGDDGALERIARCYLADLLAVGRCSCRDTANAADAVQDALAAAAERLDHYRGDGTVKAWLSKMVVNACRCRERGRKNDAAWNRPLTKAHPARGLGPAEVAARAELGGALARALAILPAPERNLFLLSHIDGVSAPELGRAFALSPEAVRARLSRTRRRLRRELGPLWRDWGGSSD